VTKSGERKAFGETIPVYDFHYMGQPIDIYKRMNIYIIDFGLSIVVDDIKTVITVEGPRGTEGFYLDELIDIDSNLITDACRQKLCLSDQYYSCSVLNDRVAVCRNIVELMMGQLWDDDIPNHWNENKHNYISFTHWFFEHKQNQCSSSIHTDHCTPIRNIWKHYTNLCDFLILLSNPNTFNEEDKDLEWWTNRFNTVFGNI
jgi:hypothetical protein